MLLVEAVRMSKKLASTRLSSSLRMETSAEGGMTCTAQEGRCFMWLIAS